MKIEIQINNAFRQFTTDIDEHWIAQQIQGRRDDGIIVCLRVNIECGAINLTLATTNCVSVPGGFRPLRSRERDVVDLWNKAGLSDPGFPVGQLMQFLKRVIRIAC